MVKKSNQFKEYQYLMVAVSIGVIGGLLLIFIGLVPSWKGMTKASQDLASAQTKRDNLTERLTNLKGLKDKEAQLKEQNAKVLAALPEDKDISRLFVEFEGIGNASGVTVKQVSEAAATVAAGGNASAAIIPVTYQISASAANYGALKDSLLKFEQALRLLTISNFDASKSGSNLNVNFTINAYKRGPVK
jgi:Tfp pilus assembly protein PilO